VDDLGRIFDKLRTAREAERQRAPRAARRARTRAAWARERPGSTLPERPLRGPAV